MNELNDRELKLLLDELGEMARDAVAKLVTEAPKLTETRSTIAKIYGEDRADCLLLGIMVRCAS